MDCAKCRELKHVFGLKLTQYVEARASVYYRVNTELAAHRNVDMERSRNEWEERQMVCASRECACECYAIMQQQILSWRAESE
jgi:hypothetical protein